MPFEITTTRHFAAAHQLVLYDGSLEPLHGHNWVVRIMVGSAKLDSIGTVMDFHELERRADAVIAPMHNRHLNELEPFKKLNPSTENVAYHVANAIRLPETVRLMSVEVWETPENSATYRP